MPSPITIKTQSLSEDAEDAALLDAALARNEEAFPLTLLESIAAGANAVHAFRTHRGITQQALAKAAGLSKPYISQLESNTRKGSTAAMKAIAKALNVPMDLLLT